MRTVCLLALICSVALPFGGSDAAAEDPEGLVIALHGDLGAGKTCFVQGLAEALRVEAPVSSPTYTLINEYPGPRPLIHIDLYRMADAEEAQDAGLLELFEEPAVMAVEWPERAVELFPPDAWHVHLETVGPEARRIRFHKGAPS